MSMTWSFSSANASESTITVVTTRAQSPRNPRLPRGNTVRLLRCIPHVPVHYATIGANELSAPPPERNANPVPRADALRRQLRGVHGLPLLLFGGRRHLIMIPLRAAHALRPDLTAPGSARRNAHDLGGRTTAAARQLLAVVKLAQDHFNRLDDEWFWFWLRSHAIRERSGTRPATRGRPWGTLPATTGWRVFGSGGREIWNGPALRPRSATGLAA